MIFGSVRIVAELQKHIDRVSSGRLFIFIGHNHQREAHYRFFNELLTPGRDQIFLEGLTHIALETFMTEYPGRKLTPRLERMLYNLWRGRYNRRRWTNIRQKLAALLFFDQQPLIDLYVKKGRKWAYQLLEVIGSFFLSPAYSFEIIRLIHQTLTVARNYPWPLEVVATDMSVRLRSKLQHLACWLYPLRELFALYMVKSRLRGSRNVLLFFWGANHIRRDHFPRFISSGERLLTILLSGGGQPDVWDLALQKIGIAPTAFAIYTPGAREADLMVHLPPEIPHYSQKSAEGALSAIGRKPPKNPIDRADSDRSELLSFHRRQQIRALKNLLSLCLKERRRKKIYFKIHLSPDGRVLDTEIYSPTPLPKLQKRCLNRTVRKVKFPSDDRFSTLVFWIN